MYFTGRIPIRCTPPQFQCASADSGAKKYAALPAATGLIALSSVCPLKPLRGLVTNNMGEADRDAEGDLHRV